MSLHVFSHIDPEEYRKATQEEKDKIFLAWMKDVTKMLSKFELRTRTKW